MVGKTHFNNDLPHGFDVRIDTREYREYLAAEPPKQPAESIKTRPTWRPFRDPAKMPLPVGSPEDDRWIPKIFRDLTDQDAM